MYADHFHYPEWCDKCHKYYNPKSPHLCFADDTSLEEWRRQLKKWLGRGTVEIPPKEV